MMDKGPFARFDLVLVSTAVFASFSLLIASCATAKTLTTQREIGSTKPSTFDVKTELSSDEVVSGSLLRVTLHIPEKLRKKQIQGEFEGTEIPFFPAPNLGEGVFESVLGIPYQRKAGAAQLTVRATDEQGVSEIQVPFKVKEGDYPSEILRVDGRRVNPQNKRDVIRIIREQAEVAEIYKRVTRQKFWPGPFLFPIQSQITSPFGTKRIYNGQLKNFHPGLDLKAPMRTPVLSSAPGIVVLAKNLFYTGNTVMIDHGYGIITLYAHMTSLQVKLGQTVKARELLGLSGKTGRVNGPHLHWQAVVHRVKVNPLGLTQVVR